MAFFRPKTAVNALVVMSTTSVTIIADAQGPNFRSIMNTSGQAMYVLFGAGTALVGAHTVTLAAGAYYEFPTPMFYGPVQAALATGSGNILVTTY